MKIASVSLMSKDKQYIKRGCGVPGDLTGVEKKDRLCAWTLLPEYPEVLVVPDSLQDMRHALSSIFSAQRSQSTSKMLVGSVVICVVHNMEEEEEKEEKSGV